MGSAGHVRAVTDRARQWIRRLPPPVILALAWAWLLVYAFPGVMTMDSFDQLREGRDWFFTDSHPPIMAALWGILDRIVAGPFTMLVIQSGTFLAGLYLVLRRVMAPRTAALCAGLLFVYPPIFCTFAVIWKDCLMAGALMLGIAWVGDARRAMRVLALVAFTVATALRYNAPAATLPLVVLLFEWKPGLAAVKRYALATATWLAVTLAAFGVNGLVTDREMHFWHNSMAFADIVGTLEFVDGTLPDDQLRPLLAPTEILVDTSIHDRIRAKYKAYDFQQLISGEGQLWNVPWVDPLPAARRDAISHAWWTLIHDHPWAFVRYRLDNFGETLGVNSRFHGATIVTHGAQYKGMLDNFGFASASSPLQQHAEDAYLWLVKHTRLFRPHLYALLALGLLGLAIAWRQRDVIAYLVSGIFMELTLFVLGGTPDYRYSHWLVVTTCVSLVVLIARRRREGDIARDSG